MTRRSLARPARARTWACAAFGVTLAAAGAAAAAPAGGSVEVGTGKGARASGRSGRSKYDWPEVVVSGNAISFLAPLQFGLVSYLPKARFAFQYDRQIRKGHWFHLGLALLFDRAGFENFRMNSCNSADFSCDKGGVVGVDAYLGYTYKFFLQKKPYLVPYVRGSLGYSFFDLPKVGGGTGNRYQSRVHSQGLSLRPGGGLRIFPLDQLGIGMDIALPLGFLVHQTRDNMGTEDRNTTFLLGIEVLPLVVEYRF